MWENISLKRKKIGLWEDKLLPLDELKIPWNSLIKIASKKILILYVSSTINSFKLFIFMKFYIVDGNQYLQWSKPLVTLGMLSF